MAKQKLSEAVITARREVFKPLAKGDRIRTCYLYADGHVIVTFERRLKDIDKSVTYLKIAQSVGLSVYCSTSNPFTRVVFSSPALLRAMLDADASHVHVHTMRLENGTPSTQAHNVRVGYIQFQTPHGMVDLYQTSDLTGDFCIQATNDVAGSTFAEDTASETWGYGREHRVAQVLRTTTDEVTS